MGIPHPTYRSRDFLPCGVGETDIRFIYAPSDAECDTEPSVLFEQAMPWQLNETEKALTESELDDICVKYTKELGIKTKPDYLALEYFG